MSRSDDLSRESGFTLVELLVTMMILGIVSASLVGVLVSQTNVEKRVQAHIANQEEVRLAMVEMQRDIRSSEPLVELAVAGDYAHKLELKILDLDDHVQYVRWKYDSVANELRREELDATTKAITGTSYRLRGVEDPANSRVFRYFNAAGDLLDTAGPKTIASCTIRVEISLVAGPHNGPNPYVIKSDAELRNRLPGGLGC